MILTPDFSSNRFEIKYLLPVKLLPQLHEVLGNIVTSDEHANPQDGFYYNQSIYFDTPHLEYYFAKREGLNERIKVRLRSYRSYLDGDPSRSVLEFKHRVGRIVSKERQFLDNAVAVQTVSGVDLAKLIDSSEANSTIRKYFYLVKRKNIKPVVTILYKRKAFLMPQYPGVRLTIDTGVRAGWDHTLTAPAGPMHYLLDPRCAVIELKFFRTVPRLIIRRLNKICLTEVTFSKYARGVEKNYSNLTKQTSKRRFSATDPLTVSHKAKVA